MTFSAGVGSDDKALGPFSRITRTMSSGASARANAEMRSPSLLRTRWASAAAGFTAGFTEPTGQPGEWRVLPAGKQYALHQGDHLRVAGGEYVCELPAARVQPQPRSAIAWGARAAEKEDDFVKNFFFFGGASHARWVVIPALQRA